MTRKYTFTARDIERISEARKKNKDKRAEVRLHALQLRAEGKREKEIAKEVGVSAPYTWNSIFGLVTTTSTENGK